MTGSKIQNFDLFKAAMGNSEYLTKINKNRAAQAQFMKTLEEGHMALQDILESIQIVQDQQVRSLLIIYLLSQKKYLEHLTGDSVLNRLTVHEKHIPSRLNALVHQLDLETLTADLISTLEPEAAVSILCSVPHFHQLTNKQIDALLGRYPKHELIVYWMNHFATMPNAHHILAHLMKLAGSNVFDALSNMKSSRREVIIITILEHLELFNHIPHKFLDLANTESHLVLAIRFYLNGHYNKIYVTYINQLTKKLLEQNYSFSLSAIELLFFLSDKLAFKELASRTAPLTNFYLRNNAQKGNIGLFYQNDQITIQRMIRSIFLYPEFSETAKNNENHPFLTQLMTHNKSVNCFEYFLIHYKGDLELISQLLNHYMEFYEQPKSSSNRLQAMHHLGFMLSHSEVSATIKETIFSAFLNHPTLIDEQISYPLFLFDAKRAIHHFGLKGGEKNYQWVIDLCTWALEKLQRDQHKKIAQMAQKALSEARLELSFIKIQGFFAKVIKLIKRCWFYGWTGFFKPNLPDYVIPELDTSGKNKKQATKKPMSHIQSSRINELTALVSKEQFEEIIGALTLYSLQAAPKEELGTRQKLNNLYQQAITKKENGVLYRWLQDNQTLFIRNQFRLLELTLKEKSRNEVDVLMEQINKNSEQLRYISNELHCTMPELVFIEDPKPEKNKRTADFLANATQVFSDYIIEAKEYANSALNWAEGWTGGLFEKIQKAQEENDEFEVEHVASFQTTIKT